MTTLMMSPTLGDLLKYELNASYCRETVTLKLGTTYALGSVLGKIAASGKYRLSPAAAVTGGEGAETAIAVLIEAVDATVADKTGLVVARGPTIVSKAAWSSTQPSTSPPRSPPSTRSSPVPGSSRATPPDPLTHPSPAGLGGLTTRGPNLIEETQKNGPNDQSLRRGRLYARRDDHGHQHPCPTSTPGWARWACSASRASPSAASS
jgi:hypothetical protein